MTTARDLSVLPSAVTAGIPARTTTGFVPLTIGSGLTLTTGATPTLSATASSSTEVSQTFPGPFTFTASSPSNGRFQVVPTGGTTGGFNTTAGEMEVQFDWVSSAYFSGNDSNGAHIAVVLRCDTDVISTYVRGQGMILGNVSGSGNGGAPNHPTTQIETWFNGLAAAGNYLPPESGGYPENPLIDGQNYRCVVTSKVTPNGSSYIRYRLYRITTIYNSTQYNLERDTGDLLDVNTYIDKTKSGLVFGQVFANSSAPTWSFSISNVVVTWRPITSNVTSTGTLPYDGALYGSRIMKGSTAGILNEASGTFGIKQTGTYAVGLDLSTATHTSSAIRLKAGDKVSYEGTDVICSKFNQSNGYIEFYNGTTRRGYIDTYTGADISFNSAATLTGAANVWSGNNSFTNGIAVAGASTKIGTAIPSFYNLQNLGGANAHALIDYVTLDVDSICTVGVISSYIGGSYSAANIEGVLRPLWSMVSVLVQNLQAKKVI
jgi:hypothetical protein